MRKELFLPLLDQIDKPFCAIRSRFLQREARGLDSSHIAATGLTALRDDKLHSQSVLVRAK